MGWKSTLDITREEALKIVYDNLEDLNDELLAEVVEAALGGYEHGHNYMIVKEKND